MGRGSKGKKRLSESQKGLHWGRGGTHWRWAGGSRELGKGG